MRYVKKDLKIAESLVIPGKPQVIRTGESLLTEDEAWNITLASCADFLKRPSERVTPHIMVRLFLDGCRVDRDLTSLLPHQGDIGIEHYAQRIYQCTKRKFFIVINHIQTINWGVFERIRLHATEFAKAQGERAVRAALILSNDQFSAFGVHFDENCYEQVQDIIVGRKRAYLWNRNTLTEDERRLLTNSTQFESQRASAVVLEATEGESFSWSGDHYHVMENISEYSVAVTVTYRDRTPKDLGHELRRMLGDVAMELADRCDPYMSDPDRIRRDIATGLPAAIGPDFIRQMIAIRLCAETSGCVEYSPRLRTVERMRPGQRIKRIAQSPIRWIQLGRSLLFSSCGHFFEVEQAPCWMENFLDLISNIDDSSIEELCIASDVRESDFRIAEQVVDALRACYALE